MSTVNKRVALVTGGSRGIGAAIVRRLAADGMAVAFTYVKSAEKAQQLVSELEQKGSQVLAIQADVASAADMVAATEKAAAHFGTIHVLVNNAGVAVSKPYADYTQEDYNYIMTVNVQAPFFTTQAVLKQMPDGGRIINIGSCLADRVPGAGITLYAMSKSALTAYTKGLARDLGPRNITVNLVQPGSTDTDMNPADGPAADFQRNQMAIPRYGKGADIASLVAWVASEESGFVNGAALTIDGGGNA
ncbi:3-oxoacyl-[acyl-carrier protein] reductase [Filimonas zeae]|uniref:3-ketoacyl-ACP reductase n=1 Tax=Filimonas zeae TaxID=1737353 RepID=A0A917MXL8_9BACT|nr:3-oxoacyl-ACP reductase family protein [Filimonas zeae]MDR6341399.1 3-oxoacyl-[acyl-carrier protein] reductase [Filimonas zeae]GGH76038.1 3-ketoacyl-ACP reductase [Filimonas zeae]